MTVIISFLVYSKFNILNNPYIWVNVIQEPLSNLQNLEPIVFLTLIGQ